MAKTLVALGTVALLGTATLTTSNPAAAQPWLLPVIAGSFVTGAFVGAAAASPYPYYDGYNGYGYNGYGYNGYGYNSCHYHCGPYYGGYAEPYYGGYRANPTVVIITPHY
jgi:hypothetical protein